MQILAIDTATSCAGAAVADERGIAAQFSLNAGRGRSQAFLPMLEAMLSHSQLALTDMSAVAVTVGPGSFTGLRIGIATAKAWGQSLSMPIIGISTLEALMAAAGGRGLVCPILDARKGQVYTALFENGKRRWPDQALSIEDLIVRIKDLGQQVTLVGDGLPIYCERLAEELGPHFMEAEEIAQVTAAAGAALLARGYYHAGSFVSPEELQPVYLRLSEAEVRRLEKEGCNQPISGE